VPRTRTGVDDRCVDVAETDEIRKVCTEPVACTAHLVAHQKPRVELVDPMSS
jgi:hypothetical protein